MNPRLRITFLPFVLASIVAFANSFALAATLRVPEDFTTIQAAIDASLDGDEISIAAGTYNEALDLLGKRIVVRGRAGAAATILDGQGLNVSIVTAQSGESLDTRLEELTLTRGEGTLGQVCTGAGPDFGRGGGAIFLRDSGLSMEACRFVDNGNAIAESLWVGGAICVFDSDASFEGCTFSGNRTASGGPDDTTAGTAVAICGLSGTTTITGCHFEGNGGSISGPVLLDYGRSLILQNSRFENNEGDAIFVVIGRGANANGDPGPANLIVAGSSFVHHEGEGMVLFATEDSTIHLEDCESIGNEGAFGAGAFIVTSTAEPDGAAPEVLARRCRFEDNEGTQGAGVMILAFDGSVILDDCSVRGNRAVGVGTAPRGGGIEASASNGAQVIANPGIDITTDETIFIEGCTVTDNASGRGGGIGATDGDVEIRDSIVFGNATPGAVDGQVDITYSLIEGGAPGQGNIDADPQFVDAANGDYRLQESSPCVDTADPSTSRCEQDLTRVPRLLDGQLDGTTRGDMGCHEYSNVYLEIGGQWTPGGCLDVQVTGTPGLPVLLFVGIEGGPACLPSFGAFFLDFSSPWLLLPLGTIPRQTIFPIPGHVPTPLPLAFQLLATHGPAGNTSNVVLVAIE